MAKFLTDQFTLVGPRGQIMPTILLLTPHIFGRCGVTVMIQILSRNLRIIGRENLLAEQLTIENRATFIFFEQRK